MATESSSQTQDGHNQQETSTTMLILLMRLPQNKLSEILFSSNQKVLEELQRAFRLLPLEFIELSKSQIDQFRHRVNRLIMHHQKGSNLKRMNSLRNVMGCLKRIRKL